MAFNFRGTPPLPPLPPATRPPPLPPTPLLPPRMCRYHAEKRAAAAVYAGPPCEGDWVLLCRACGTAVRHGALRIINPQGLYRGLLPLAV